MKAVLYEGFAQTPRVTQVTAPSPAKHGAVIKVEATGVCRSDWHGWMGHDKDIELPHVPGHEFAGTIADIGREVKGWRIGDRVTAPFIAGCGHCGFCDRGDQQVCLNQTQPGFTHWGSFAEYVAVDYANHNLVALPESMDFVTAASLGCRFATAFRAVVAQGKVSGGQWLAVHGCGGVGLSAIMIAKALGARVIGIDIHAAQLSKAKLLGADYLVNAGESDVVTAIQSISSGGVEVSIDALGSAETCFNSIACLRPRGKHIQVGLMVADNSNASVPMDKILAHELEVIGSHGMQAHAYPQMLCMIESGALKPEQLIGQRITLEDSITALTSMDCFEATGVTVIDQI